MYEYPSTVEVIIKPCPWCKKTPRLVVPYENEETWNCIIYCINKECKIQPSTNIVDIRNTSKTIWERFINKINFLVNNWNTGNPCLRQKRLL